MVSNEEGEEEYEMILEKYSGVRSHRACRLCFTFVLRAMGSHRGFYAGE